MATTTTADLQAQRDALNQARSSAEAVQQNLQATSAQLTAAKAAMDGPTASISSITQVLNSDPTLVEARARAAARAALGPAITAARKLVADTDTQINQFRAEGVK